MSHKFILVCKKQGEESESKVTIIQIIFFCGLITCLGVKECDGFPGPGDMEHRITMNPMREYVHNDDRHIDDMFETFKKTHNKKYINGKDHSQRKQFFKNNVR